MHESCRHEEFIHSTSLNGKDDDPEEVEMDRQDDSRRTARDLPLVERAKEYLLDDGDG